MKISAVPLFTLVFLLASLGAVAQEELDPRWNDGDPNNDPNTCNQAGDCEIPEDWQSGWCAARQQAGLACVGEKSVDQQVEDSGDSSSRSGRQPSSSSGRQPSASTQPPRATGSNFPPSNTKCPYGKICVGHYPSGDYYVFDLNRCCMPGQEIDYWVVRG